MALERGRRSGAWGAAGAPRLLGQTLSLGHPLRLCKGGMQAGGTRQDWDRRLSASEPGRVSTSQRDSSHPEQCKRTGPRIPEDQGVAQIRGAEMSQASPSSTWDPLARPSPGEGAPCCSPCPAVQWGQSANAPPTPLGAPN